MILVAGVGIIFFSKEFCKRISNQRYFQLVNGKLSLLIVLFILLLSSPQIMSSIKYPTNNPEYSPSDYTKPIQVIKKDIKFHAIKNPVVVLRKYYFTFMADLPGLAIPYTSYEGLVKYCKLNKAAYLFLSYSNIKKYPFLKNFQEKNTPDFILLYHSSSEVSELIELYKFISN
jgi:hypothetical protein